MLDNSIGFILTITFACIGIVLSFLFLVFTYINRMDPSFRLAQPFLLMSYCFGLLFLNVSSLTLLFKSPATKELCELQVAVGHIAFTLILTCLAFKNFRLFKLFRNPRLKNIQITDKQVMIAQAFFIGLVMCLFLIWIFVEPFVVANDDSQFCIKQGGKTQIVIILIETALLAVSGFCSFHIRDLGPILGEHGMFNTMNVVLTSCFALFIDFYGMYLFSAMEQLVIISGLILWGTSCGLGLTFTNKLESKNETSEDIIDKATAKMKLNDDIRRQRAKRKKESVTGTKSLRYHRSSGPSTFFFSSRTSAPPQQLALVVGAEMQTAQASAATGQPRKSAIGQRSDIKDIIAAVGDALPNPEEDDINPSNQGRVSALASHDIQRTNAKHYGKRNSINQPSKLSTIGNEVSINQAAVITMGLPDPTANDSVNRNSNINNDNNYKSQNKGEPQDISLRSPIPPATQVRRRHSSSASSHDEAATAAVAHAMKNGTLYRSKANEESSTNVNSVSFKISQFNQQSANTSSFKAQNNTTEKHDQLPRNSITEKQQQQPPVLQPRQSISANKPSELASVSIKINASSQNEQKSSKEKLPVQEKKEVEVVVSTNSWIEEELKHEDVGLPPNFKLNLTFPPPLVAKRAAKFGLSSNQQQ